MATLEQKTVGEIVAEDYNNAQVFNEFGVDFCCGGEKTITEACAEEGIAFEKMKEALQNSSLSQPAENHDYKTWSPDFLADYITNTHHKFSREKLPEIGKYAHKVSQVHGGNHEELKEIFHEFTMMHKDIINHLDKEERILFPYIKKLVEAEESGEELEEPDFGSAANPIDMMEEEHDEAGDSMKKIRALTNDYTLPEDACTTFELLYKNLEAFEQDLHKHVHLENNILFPKAIALEEQIRS